jgi:hypothetical protein
MRRWSLLSLVMALAVSCSFIAPGDARAGNDDSFGLGVIVGEPTGLSLKFWTSGKNAVDGGLAWSLNDDSDLHVHGDFLWHNFDLINVSKGRMPLYYGIGGRLRVRENRDDLIGIRFPVGLDYLFEGAPFDIFLEIVPVLDLAPDTDVDFNAALGGRFWF